MPVTQNFPLSSSQNLDQSYTWFQTSSTKQMRSALLWVVMQRIVVNPYRRFGTTYRSHFQRSRNLGFLDLRIRTNMLVYRKRLVCLQPNNKMGRTWPNFPNHTTKHTVQLKMVISYWATMMGERKYCSSWPLF